MVLQSSRVAAGILIAALIAPTAMAQAERDHPHHRPTPPIKTVHAHVAHLNGTVQSLTADGFLLTVSRGEAKHFLSDTRVVTVTITTSTRIFKANVPVTSAAIVARSHVDVTGSLDKTTNAVVATTIHILGTEKKGHRHEDEGTVTPVATGTPEETTTGTPVATTTGKSKDHKGKGHAYGHDHDHHGIHRG